MSKRFFLFLFTIIVFLVYKYNINQTISKYISYKISDLRSYCIEQINSFNDKINIYINQSATIQILEGENDYLRKKELYLYKNQEDTQEVKNTLNSFVKAKVLSYKTLGDITKIILLSDDINNTNKIYGVIDHNNAVGVARIVDGELIAFLNGNKKSNFAVFIGDDNIPGITHKSNKGSNIIAIKYIPNWATIQIGDEVKTSGMDNIFFKGLKVGKVASIKKENKTQTAYVAIDTNIFNAQYFYLYTNKDLK